MPVTSSWMVILAFCAPPPRSNNKPNWTESSTWSANADCPNAPNDVRIRGWFGAPAFDIPYDEGRKTKWHWARVPAPRRPRQSVASGCGADTRVCRARTLAGACPWGGDEKMPAKLRRGADHRLCGLPCWYFKPGRRQKRSSAPRQKSLQKEK